MGILLLEPERIQCPSPTSHTPNSHLPILVYRAVPALLASSPAREEPAVQLAQQNGWYYGGTFKTYWAAHYHTVTHEAYAVISGSSTLRLGVGPLDNQSHGVLTRVTKGDVIIQPAGVAHASIDEEGAYEYIGFYPNGSPKYDNNWCKDDTESTKMKGEQARSVPIPDTDLVNGHDGPLVRIWREADQEHRGGHFSRENVATQDIHV